MSLIGSSYHERIAEINFKDVFFSWPGAKENVISKCNCSIDKPGLWMIIGKNGSGKSTFLKLINGILKPTSGNVKCLGNIGMVFQNPDHQILMPNCRSELLINISQKMSGNDINSKIDYVLNQVGLNGFENRPIHTLSGGQKQRLTIACALISDKNIILLDEPTALLDKTNQIKVIQTIKNLTKYKNKPVTALWITHRQEELSYADFIAEMKNGNLSGWEKSSKFKFK